MKYLHFNEVSTMKTIRIRTAQSFGVTRFYAEDTEQAQALRTLTGGKKTLDESDFEALKLLGFEIVFQN